MLVSCTPALLFLNECACRKTSGLRPPGRNSLRCCWGYLPLRRGYPSGVSPSSIQISTTAKKRPSNSHWNRRKLHVSMDHQVL